MWTEVYRQSIHGRHALPEPNRKCSNRHTHSKAAAFSPLPPLSESSIRPCCAAGSTAATNLPAHILVPICNSLLSDRLSSLGERGLEPLPPSEFLLECPLEEAGLFTLPEEPGRCPVLLLLDLGPSRLELFCADFTLLPPCAVRLWNGQKLYAI